MRAPLAVLTLWLSTTQSLDSYAEKKLRGTWTGALKFNFGFDNVLNVPVCLTKSTYETSMTITFEDGFFTYSHAEKIFNSSGHVIRFPGAKQSGIVTEFYNDKLTLQSDSSSMTACRRLYKEPGTTGGSLEYTLQTSIKAGQASPCPDGGLSASCSGFTGLVTVKAQLVRDTAIRHSVPRGTCVQAGMPWRLLLPVDCVYRDPEKIELWVWIVLAIAALVGVLCAMCIVYHGCRWSANQPYVWTCCCRLFCAAACDYGINSATVVPMKYEEEEKPIYKAKKYRRVTTAELAGQMTAEEAAAARSKDATTEAAAAAEFKRKRRHSMAPGKVGEFFEPSTLLRPENPSMQTVGSVQSRAAEEPTMPRQWRAKKQNRRKSVGW